MGCGIYRINQQSTTFSRNLIHSRNWHHPHHAPTRVSNDGTLGGQTLCSSEVRRRTTQILALLSAASRNLARAQDENPILVRTLFC